MEKVKKNYKFILFSIVLIIFNTFLLLNKLNICLLIITIFIDIIFILYLLFLIKRKYSIEKIYLFIMIPLGIFYMFAFPINRQPDEFQHFLRAAEISEGYIISKHYKNNSIGRKLDVNYQYIDSLKNYQISFHEMNIKKSNDRKIYGFSNTALYSFACYIPQSLGVFIGRVLNLPIYVYDYLGRILNFICFLIITYISMKIMPIKKISMFIILLLPITIELATSLSPDALTIAMSLFLISYVLKLRNEKDKLINKKDIIILFFTIIYIALSKIVYLPLCLLILLIPKEKFKTSKFNYILLFMMILISISLNLLWLSNVSGFLPARSDVNSKKQFLYIISDIYNYVAIVIRTYVINGLGLLLEEFGRILGLFTVYLSDIYIYLNMGMFLLISIIEYNKNKIYFKYMEKLFMVLIYIVIVILISTSLYLQWTPVGKNLIIGIQGRYFLPLVMLFPILFNGKKNIIIPYKYVLVFMIMESIYALNIIFYTFM